MVKLAYHGELRDRVGVSGEEIPAASFKEVFRHILKAYGKEACQIAKSGLVTLNQEKVTSLRARIPPGSVVGFYTFCTGG